MTKPNRDWIDVDRHGLAALLERRGIGWAIYELVQNALDTDATEVIVTLEEIPRSPRVRVTVEDNDPTGFRDLRHAFTMFAPSVKASDAARRGRFNLGCKLVLARCHEATVTSTTGTVHFDEEGRHDRPRTKRAVGSSFTGILALTRAELHEIHACLLRIMPPARTRVVATWVTAEGTERQDTLTAPEPIVVFPADLVTEVAQKGGGAALRRVERRTTVHVHPAHGPGWLYELGIPVVVIDGPYHLDVQQKVPQGFDRDGVAPGWLAKLRALALNALADRPETDVTAPWVSEAVTQPQVAPAAVQKYLTGKYGPKFVIDDPSNRESVREAQAAGYAVIRGGAEARETWEVIRDHQLAAPASRLFPPPAATASSTIVPYEALSPAYRAAVGYARALADRILHRAIDVRVIDSPEATVLATWRRGERPVLTLNRARLEPGWFCSGPAPEVNDLLIHEMAHQSGDHLETAFDDAMSRIGAAMVHLALSEPAFFAHWFAAAEGAATL